MRVGLAPGMHQRIVGCDEADVVIDSDDARFDHRKRSPMSAEVDGFYVHAGVRMRAEDPAGRERLVRYCARPALSLERLSVLPSGLIAYRTKYPLRGGKNHGVMTPMECMARLAALVPPPRYPLVRYVGVLAPASKLRRLVVPVCDGARCDHRGTGRLDGHGQKEGKPIAGATGGVELCQAPSGGTPGQEPQADRAAPRNSSYIDWATLMRRGLGIDVLDCPRCHE